MKLTPETIDAALDEYWCAPWREHVDIEPGADPDSFEYKLTRLDSMKCENEYCGEYWEDDDMHKSRAIDGWVCPECIKWPENW